FNGTIDDLRVYNRVLSAAEIQALASNSAPSAPGALSSSASSSNQVNLRWSPSSSAPGVTGYGVERCAGSGCTTFAPIGTTTATAYMDGGVSPSTAYNYRVRANDANGSGPYSNTLSIATPASVGYPCPSTAGA